MARVTILCRRSPHGVKVWISRLDDLHHSPLPRKLTHARDIWPKQLLKFKRIELLLPFRIGTFHGVRERASVMEARKVSLNHSLYSLTCFLATSKRLKTMDLRIDEASHTRLSNSTLLRSPVEPEKLTRSVELCAILWPCSRLLHELDLRLNGAKIDEKHPLGSIRPQAEERASIDVLTTARSMLRKVEVVEQLIEVSQAINGEDVAHVASCAHGLRSVFALEEYVNQTEEQKVQLSIERAKRCLSDNFIRGVRAAAVRRVERLLASVDLDVDEEKADGDGARGE